MSRDHVLHGREPVGVKYDDGVGLKTLETLCTQPVEAFHQ